VILNLRKNDQFSSIPWLNKKLLQFELTPYLRKRLDQANLSWSAGRLLMLSAVCFAVPSYLVDWKTSMILPSLGVGLVTGLGPYGFVLFKRSKRFAKFEERLPEALDLMVSGLRAGHSLIAAMGLVGREVPDPVGGEFKACFEEQNYGLELKSAIENLIDRVPLQDMRIVATAIMIQKESGGNLAEVLDKTSYVIRERFRLKREIRTHTAQGRLTGWILSLLPVVLGIALFFVNPQMMSILWTRPIGVDLLWASAAMTVVGGLIIRHIVNMEV
jgi:tight adherence protein B